jgi:hypothetical protein
MTAKSRYQAYALWIGLWTLAVLAACGGGGSDSSANRQQSYTIELTNLTANQPFSPVALAFHQPTLSLWEAGDSASIELEVLAESGDPQPFLDAAATHAMVVDTLAGSGVIPPGGGEAFSVTFSGDESIVLTLATMLVNSNDAFAGTSGATVPSLAVGESRTWYLPAYDAGTEANTETAATIPGPAAGGEGFNAARDEGDRIAIHPGIISNQDGQALSVLDGSHRWDNPVLKVDLVRTE